MIPFRSALKLHRVRSDVEALAPIPAGILEIVRLGSSDYASVADLADACATQATLTRTILREANTTSSSASEITASVAGAVERMGKSRTLTAVLGSVLAGTMDQSLEGYGLARHEMWRHSVITAHIAEVVREQSGVAVSAELPIAALVHDIGIVLMHQHLQGQMSSRIHRGRFVSPAMERGLFGLDHAELGAEIVAHWGLSAEIADAVHHHHAPADCPTNLAFGVLAANEVGSHIMGHVDPTEAHRFSAAVDALELDVAQLHAAATERLVSLGILEDESALARPRLSR